jgi:hypothetical protein
VLTPEYASPWGPYLSGRRGCRTSKRASLDGHPGGTQFTLLAYAAVGALRCEYVATRADLQLGYSAGCRALGA